MISIKLVYDTPSDNSYVFFLNHYTRVELASHCNFQFPTNQGVLLSSLYVLVTSLPSESFEALIILGRASPSTIDHHMPHLVLFL